MQRNTRRIMKNIAVIGACGFVGNALTQGMVHAFDVIAFDIKQGIFCVSNSGKCRVSLPEDNYLHILKVTEGPVFVCVPTPMNADGSCNTDIVESVVAQINEASAKLNQKTIVVVKSTVPPGTCEKLGEKYTDCYVCFNPEFLTERNAVEDFKNQDRIIIGGPREGTNVLKQVYERAYPDVPVTKTSSTIAELVKYTTNCFLATKVSFANEMYEICQKLNVDYDKLIEYATKDKRLGTSHWSVPGPDGKNGFGLTCFPKDLNALIAKSCELGFDPILLKAVWERNLIQRPEKDWEQMKGRAVN